MEEHDPLLSEAYRQAARGAEPPAALDARILEAARQAVANEAVANKAAAKSRPRRAGWLRWALPASTTAVLVVAVTLLLRMREEAPGPSSADYAPAAETPAPAAAEASSPAAKSVATSVTTPAATAAARERLRPDRNLASPAAESSPRTGAEPARAGVAAAPAEADAAAPRIDRPSAPLPFPPAASMERARADTQAAPPSPAAGEAAGTASAPAGVSAAPSAAGSLEMRKAKQSPSTTEDAEQGIERIRRLLREGRGDEARQALAEFVRRYPGYVLPADLHGLR